MRGFRGGGFMTLIAGALSAISMNFVPPKLPELKFTRKHPNYEPPQPRKTTWHPMNGRRECLRRLRQITAGTLRHENGLDPSVEAVGMTRRQALWGR